MQMTGGDFVVCKEASPDVIVAHDYHATGNKEPALDNMQDWKTHHSGRESGVTFCEVSRAFIGCDEEQVSLTSHFYNALRIP